jgi:hypothetical protein
MPARRICVDSALMASRPIPRSAPPAERLPWPTFRRRFISRFDQGDLVTILGGPESGKTHLAVLVAEMRKYGFFMATKPRDPLIAKLHARGWTVSSTLDPMEQMLEVTDERGRPVLNPDGTRKLEPVYPRFVYWPQPVPAPNVTLAQQADLKAAAVQAALVVLQRHGSYTVVLDETNYLTDTLRLRRELSELWHVSRTNMLTVIANAQRPSWVPRAALDNPGHFFIFQASDQQELRRLGEITGGLDWRPIAEEITTLRWNQNEFLYIAPRERLMLRSSAPPW